MPQDVNKKTTNRQTPETIKDQLDHYLLHGTALVVDDEEGIRKLLSNYLEDMGLEVETADDGDSALEMVKLKKYDYIFTDMTMPRMTGHDFISQAKKHPFGQTKFYIITAGITASYSKEKEEMIKEEVEAYIYKPFTHKKLFNALSIIKKV
jgi:CheY-like chemotaxis protein